MFLLSFALVMKELFLLIGYYNNNSFPQPLKPNEEKIYLQKMADGDDEAKNILIERNLRLVAHVIKKFDTNTDKEDLLSIGTIGLIKAIKTFRIDCGTRLATYAARCIENEILMYFRSTAKKKPEVSLQEPLGIDSEGNEIKLEDVLPVEESVYSQVERLVLTDGIKSIIEKKLWGRDREVITMRFGLFGKKRYTQKEIASNLGISRSYVSRIEKRAIQKIAKEFQ